MRGLRRSRLRMPGSGARPALSVSRFARNRTTTAAAAAARAPSESRIPVIQSLRKGVLTDLKLDGASIIFTPNVMAGECS